MKRIRLTESQVQKLKETLNSKKKKQVIRITESQYTKLTENVKTIQENGSSLGEISELEFFEQMMYFLENMNSGSNGNVPEILSSTGITSQKLKELLIGHGILKMVRTDDGLVPKIQGNGISKSLGKLFGDIQKQYTEKPEEEKEEITEESGDYPAGAEYDPNAPYNQPEEEQIPYGDIRVNRIIDTFDDFTIIDTDKGFILAFDVDHGQDDSYDNPERNISQNLSQMTISTDPYEFVNGESNAVYLNNETLGVIGSELSEDYPELSQSLSKLGGNFISEEENILNENGSNPLELIIFLQDHEAYEALDLLKEKGPDSVVQYLSQWDNGDGGEETDSDSFGSGDKTYETDNYIMIYNTSYGYVGLYKKMSQLDEMTTTGSVGGSFETPAAWSKDPKKPRHSDKTALDGGKFIKPSIGDKMDPIRK